MNDEQKAMIIRIANQRRRNRPLLTESNIDAMLERADALSRQRLKQPLGPFWLISLDPEGAYDTPYSGWA